MLIGISPLVDFAFKLMLGSPLHTRVTIHFLNSILVGQPRITHVRVLNPILDREFDDDKLSVLDILATDEHGRLLNIEMQMSLSAGMWQRLAYYVSTVYVGQLREGDQYSDLRPAISICVLSEFVFAKSSDLHLDFRFREASGRILTDDLQIHLLQLRNLRVTAEKVYNSTPAERWAFFLLNADKLSYDDVRHIFPDEEFSEAAGVLEMISQTPQQMMLYNARLKFQRDEFARLEQSRLEVEQSRFEVEQSRFEVEQSRFEVEQSRLELEQARIEGEQARVEGEQARVEGEARGMNLGRIKVLQELLGLQPSTAAELAEHDDTQLFQLAEQLQHQLRTRRES
jgi:predicted transposase/invertase (TIGR01784 family)